MIGQFLRSTQNRGLARTLKIAGYELWYERKFGAPTGTIISAEHLDFDSEARSHARDYFPSSYLFMREALAQIDPNGQVFVDYGCGKGRAMLFASTLPFKQIIGVELSPSLAEQARSNLSRYYRRTGKTSPSFSIAIADARNFNVPPDATILYFFNPFDAAILTEVADKILFSVREAPRVCTVIYVKPVHETIFIEHGFVKQSSSCTDFSLFKLTPPHTRTTAN